jgi:hypothetical protein
MEEGRGRLSNIRAGKGEIHVVMIDKGKVVEI